jgi:hypothetical protein
MGVNARQLDWRQRHSSAAVAEWLRTLVEVLTAFSLPTLDALLEGDEFEASVALYEGRIS